MQPYKMLLTFLYFSEIKQGCLKVDN